MTEINLVIYLMWLDTEVACCCANGVSQASGFGGDRFHTLWDLHSILLFQVVDGAVSEALKVRRMTHCCPMDSAILTKI
jgi:hypothetical protein